MSGIVLALCAWGPFLWFEANRKWLDLKTIADASDKCLPVGAKVDDRYTALRFALSHLGQSQHGPVHLTRVISALVLLAIVMALARRRLRDPGFALPAAMLAFGVAVQVAVDQGERTDVLMLWLVPLYALAAWAVVQTVEVVRPAFARRAVVPSIVVVVVALVAVIGTVDLADSISATADDEQLSEAWRAARGETPVYYDAGVHPALSSNRFYLPCDPPYDWGSQIWYLQEVLHPGSGLAAAQKGGAFRARVQPPCERA